MTTSHSRCERTHTDAMAIDPNVNMADFFPAGGQTGRPRSFKKRRRRNRSNFFYLLESAGKISEESDTTDEALRDYMENIAAQQSDSDLDINMARRLSSLRCQLNNLTNEPHPLAEKVDSDSCAELSYQKKRRKRKRKQKKMCAGNSCNTHNSPSVTLQPSLFKLPSMMNQSKLHSPHYTAGKHVVLKAHRSRLNDDGFLADVENTNSCSEYANYSVSGVPTGSLGQKPQWYYSKHESAMECGQDSPDSDHDTMNVSDYNTHETESSALSSSSEDNLFTNDEGQFGDDEQEESCYETDSQCWWRGRSNSDEGDQRFHKLYRETLEYLKSKPFFVEEDQGWFAELRAWQFSLSRNKIIRKKFISSDLEKKTCLPIKHKVKVALCCNKLHCKLWDCCI